MRSVPSLVIGVILLSAACVPETGLKGIESDTGPTPDDTGGGDTGGGDTGACPLDTGSIEEGSCFVLPEWGYTPAPGHGWSGPACFGNDSTMLLQPGGAKLVGYELFGSADSFSTSTKPTGAVRLVEAVSDGSSYPYPDTGNLYGDDLTASGSDGSWTATADASATNNLDSCFDICDYNPIVEIGSLDPQLDTNYECLQTYYPVEFCPVWEYCMAARKVPAMSTCTPGSGNFRLYPTRVVNHDGDDHRSVIWHAVQFSGTGSLTNAAWISSIQVLQSQGAALRVLRANRDFRFDALDQLIDPHFVSKGLTDSPISFPGGVISGGAPFVTVEVPETIIADFSVAMSWACGTPLPLEEISPIQGYTFKPGDIGCYLSSWPQKFTVRPRPLMEPKRLDIELYGSVAHRQTIPLTPGPNGSSLFNSEISGMRLRGAILSRTGEEAEVRIDELAWKNVDLCDPGTYTIPAEE